MHVLNYHHSTLSFDARGEDDKFKYQCVITLVREPKNKYDRWAIAVYTMDGKHLGYVTRYKNETIARLMDAGYTFHAIVESRKKSNYQVPDEQRAYTENFMIPYSIWME